MNKEQVKIHLAGYRPEIYQDDDPQIAEALRIARADPDLSAWLDEEIAFDHALAATLRRTPPNPGGIESILQAAREGKAEPRSRRRTAVRLALAVAAVLMLGGFLAKYFLFPAPVTFAGVTSDTVPGFRDAMAYFANQRFVLDQRTSDLEEARRWLVDHKSPVYPDTPENILRYKGMGCKAIDWHGTQVSLICFRNDRDDLVHLFVVDVTDLADADDANLGRLQRFRGLETQGWRNGNLVCLYVGANPEVSLAGLL